MFQGELSEVLLPVDSRTRKLKGFAIVTFLFPEQAVQAYSELDGTVFEGRMLHLLPAKSKPSIDELLEQGLLSISFVATALIILIVFIDLYLISVIFCNFRGT